MLFLVNKIICSYSFTTQEKAGRSPKKGNARRWFHEVGTAPPPCQNYFAVIGRQ